MLSECLDFIYSNLQRWGRNFCGIRRLHLQIMCDACSYSVIYFSPFFQIVEEACTNLLPNVLCEYLYGISEDFSGFYSTCQVFA